MAPNSPLREAVAALVIDIPVVAVPVVTVPDEADQASAKRSPARYLWAMLITRIYEVFPLSCLHYGGEKRLIAVINEGMEIRRILVHLGEPPDPPKISAAREPPLGDACDEARKDQFDVEVGEVIDAEPEWDTAQQSMPDVQFDQSVSW